MFNNNVQHLYIIASKLCIESCTFHISIVENNQIYFALLYHNLQQSKFWIAIEYPNITNSTHLQWLKGHVQRWNSVNV